MNLQRTGGLAALYEAAAFIIGFFVYVTVLEPARYGAATIAATRHVDFLAANQTLLTAWNFVIYIAFGAVLVVLSVALHARSRDSAPALAGTAAAFGLIWAGLVIAAGMVANIGMGVIVDLNVKDPDAAALVWLSYKFIVGGLGGGNEIVGGLWVGLVSLAALRTRSLPGLLNYFGIAIGVSGLLTSIPGLELLGSVFGLGLILWFAVLGLVMLRDASPKDVRADIAA